MSVYRTIGPLVLFALENIQKLGIVLILYSRIAYVVIIWDFLQS